MVPLFVENESREAVLRPLKLCILPYLDPPADRSFTQEIARLPVTNLAALELDLHKDGHIFGSLLSHLLKNAI